MELDALAAILIGIYQIWTNLSGMNSTSVITILGLIVNVYIIHVIILKEKKDKKV